MLDRFEGPLGLQEYAGVKVLVLEHCLEEPTGLLQARRREALEFEGIIGDPEQRSAFIAPTDKDCLWSPATPPSR